MAVFETFRRGDEVIVRENSTFCTVFTTTPLKLQGPGKQCAAQSPLVARQSGGSSELPPGRSQGPWSFKGVVSDGPTDLLCSWEPRRHPGNEPRDVSQGVYGSHEPTRLIGPQLCRAMAKATSKDESTGFPVDWFVDPPPRGFICDICTDVLNNPQELTTCGHIFCKRCITQWISQNQTCPKDRKNITSSSLRDPSVIWCQMLGDLRVRCPESGCKDVVTLDALSNHRRSCKTTMVQCPGGCGLKMLKKRTIKHSCVNYLQQELAKVKAVSQMNAEQRAVLKTRLDDFLKLTDTLDVFQTLGQQIAKLKETSEEDETQRTAEIVQYAEKLDATSLDDQQLHQIAKKIVAACSRPIPGRTVETVLKPYDPSSVGPLLHATFDESLHSPEAWDILSKRLVDLAKRPDVTTMEAIISGFQAFMSEIGDLRKDYKESIDFVREIAYRVSLVHPSPLIFLLEVLKPMNEPPQDEFLVNYKSAPTRESDVKEIFSVILNKIRAEKGLDYVIREWKEHQTELQTFFNAEKTFYSLFPWLAVQMKIRSLLEQGGDYNRIVTYANGESPIHKSTDEFLYGLVHGVCDYCFDEARGNQWRENLRKLLPVFLLCRDLNTEIISGADGYARLKEDFQVKLITGFQDSVKSRGFPVLFQMGDVLSVLTSGSIYSHPGRDNRHAFVLITLEAIKSWARGGTAEEEALKSCSKWLG
ncbi:unnamed protein product [Cyprideis torosa]|uniref:Uncharacterized protein n=1 Tax=Cyprideis torosa TaxID=163714 RepID=A0A7R8WJA0_9CRUS|nr:unnamed protein product [Cyprideis torosa]CAG0901757.1 unnamed protein product [Cyprideis torosa]